MGNGRGVRWTNSCACHPDQNCGKTATPLNPKESLSRNRFYAPEIASARRKAFTRAASSRERGRRATLMDSFGIGFRNRPARSPGAASRQIRNTSGVVGSRFRESLGHRRAVDQRPPAQASNGRPTLQNGYTMESFWNRVSRWWPACTLDQDRNLISKISMRSLHIGPFRRSPTTPVEKWVTGEWGKIAEHVRGVRRILCTFRVRN
jgi:hypothetical protein